MGIRLTFSAYKIDVYIIEDIHHMEKFVYKANYKDLKKAYQMSFFPGVKALDARTNCLETENYMDIVVAHSFIVY